MKTVKIANRKVCDLVRLRAHLVAAGFPSAQVGCDPSGPDAYVYLDDAEPKDPTASVNAYVDPAHLKVTSNKSGGVGGVPEALANGVDTHTLTIKKIDPVTGADIFSGAEQVQVIPSQLVTVIPSKPNLIAGQITVEVGPTSMVGEFTVKVCDPAGALGEASIRLRFA